MELTSLINMIDLEQQGSRPLVDLNSPPPLTLDSGPRSLGSGRNALEPGSIPPGTIQLPTTTPGIGALGYPNAGKPLPPPFGPNPGFDITQRGPGAAGPRAFTPDPLGSQERLPQPRRQSTVAPNHEPRQSTMGGRTGLRPWIVIVGILLVAGIVAIIVAMSGPNVVPGK
jgi:hypothetical protein